MTYYHGLKRSRPSTARPLPFLPFVIKNQVCVQNYNFMLANPDFYCKIAPSSRHRAVAQAGSALRSGRRGRRFESCQLDSFGFRDAVAAAQEWARREKLPRKPAGTYPVIHCSRGEDAFLMPKRTRKPQGFRIPSCFAQLTNIGTQLKSFLTPNSAHDYVRS